MTTAAQEAELAKPKVNCALFLEMQFASATTRVCSYSNTYTWGGVDWSGLGQVGNISQIRESGGVGSSAMTFGLNIASSALLAVSVGPVEEYRGKPAKLYFAPLTEHGELILNDAGSIEKCWGGRMDVISTGVDGEEGQIILKCETSAFGLKRSSLRLNAAQQRQRYPDVDGLGNPDTGFDYLTDMIAKPQVWLSRKFQQI